MGNRKKRLERLEGLQETGAPIIIVGNEGTKEKALERHLAEHPEDATKAKIIINCSSAPRDSKVEANCSGNSTSRPDKSARHLQITK